MSSNGPSRRAVSQQLSSYRAAGVTDLPQAIPLPEPADALLETDALPQENDPETGVDMKKPQAKEPKPSQAATLEVLQQEVAACTRCSELASTRTQTVFGVGNPNAQICFVGEAPGADEDRLGEPFVGRSGKLLTKIIEACGVSRDDIYIMNVLKCRPPNNRNPSSDEVSSCRGFFDRQLELVKPELICCLGTVAAQNLLSTNTPIGKLRGSFHDYKGIKVVCTYHPAYLLRNPPAKRFTWDDMKMLMREAFGENWEPPAA